jgi:crotonobetainyl-CoA:carnitine CoA-transferase CaiB-like acyl-CoA transferase
MGSIPIHNVSPRLMGTPGQLRRAAPEMGQHNHEILRGMGLSDADIEALVRRGVLAGSAKVQDEECP